MVNPIDELQNQIATLHQIATLQQQMQQATQAYANLLASHEQNQNHPSSSLKAGKPEKFDGKNARSWLKSLENVFELQP